MNEYRRQRVTGAAALCLFILALTVPGNLRAQSPALPVPDEVAEVSFEQRLDNQVPLDLPFRDARGQSVVLGDYFGDQPVVLCLVYYECPMLCTLVLNGLVDCLNELPFEIGEEFQVVTLSFDHEETHVLAAAKKAAYLDLYECGDATDGWHFLVGEEEPVRQLADAVGFSFKYIPEQDEYSHRSGIVLLTPGGRVSRYFPGVLYEPQNVKFGLIEASENKIGSVVDKLFLLCYHYDPTVGTYGLLIHRVINLACTATVIALGAVVAVFVMKERKSKRVAHV